MNRVQRWLEEYGMPESQEERYALWLEHGGTQTFDEWLQGAVEEAKQQHVYEWMWNQTTH